TYAHVFIFFFSSRRRHTRSKRDWSSDVCSSDLTSSRGSCSAPSRAEPPAPRGHPGLGALARDRPLIHGRPPDDVEGDTMRRRQILTSAAVATTMAVPAAAAAPGRGRGPTKPPGNGETKPPGLAKKDTLAFAAGSTLKIGCAVAGGGHHTEADYPDPFSSDEPYREVLASEFTSLSAENQMKWDHLRPAPDTYDFTDADAIADFAEANGQVMRGHTLMWHSQNPEWIEEGDHTPEQLREILKDHIFT